MIILPGSGKNSSCCILDQLEFVKLVKSNSTLRFLTDEETLTEQPSSVRQFSRLLHAEVFGPIIYTSLLFLFCFFII